jgi:hypothetical protein
MEIWKTRLLVFKANITYCKVDRANVFLRFLVDEYWGGSKPEFL